MINCAVFAGLLFCAGFLYSNIRILVHISFIAHQNFLPPPPWVLPLLPVWVLLTLPPLEPELSLILVLVVDSLI